VDTVPAAGDVAGRADLTDPQWAILGPLLPKGKKPGRPPTWSRQQLINGVRWRTRTGAPWWDVPPSTGRMPASTGGFDAGSATGPGDSS
jgi:transposase